MERIDTVRNDLKVLLGEGLDMALKRLGEEIDPGSPKFDIYIQLKSRYSAYLSLTIIGGTAQKELDQTYNALGASLLTFINTLQEQDLKSQQEAAPPAASKRGELLYNIPHEMQEQHEHRCAVRVAYEETALLEGWKAGKEDVRRQVRVAEVMAVEMLNVSSDQPFEIRVVSETVQFLEPGEPTEWVFYIKPLLRGEFPLVLKVSVIEIINGREAKKDVVIEEHVIVSNTTSEEEAFKSAGVDLNLAAPVSDAAPEQSRNTKSKGKAPVMAALLAVVILLPSVTWALTPAPTRDWWWAAWQDTAESYAAYADKYRDTDSPHLQKALLRKAWRSGRVQDYRRYLSTFGANAQYRSQVLDSLNVLEDRRLKLFLQHPDSSALHRYLADFPENERLDKLEQAAVNLAPGSARTAILSAIAAKRGNTGGPGTPGRDSIPANTALPDSDTTALLPDRRTGDAQGSGILPQRPGVIVPAKTDPFGFEMVLVKGGTFTMGQPDPNIFCEGCSGNECPHEVTVRTFSIGKYEVTQKQWKQVMGANPSYFNTCDDCPVEQVSWQDVQRFLAAVNAKLPAGQKKYRLPTEAEWEFAARGGNRSKNFACSGSNDPAKVAWFDKNAAGKTHPVGKLAANELGLYDMSGNVYEWCADVWKPYSCDSKTAPNRLNHVTRGGSWRFYGNMCRSTIRDSYSAAHNKEVIGFRLAR